MVVEEKKLSTVDQHLTKMSEYTNKLKNNMYNKTICSVYPIENYNRGTGDNSDFARPMLPHL